MTFLISWVKMPLFVVSEYKIIPRRRGSHQSQYSGM